MKAAARAKRSKKPASARSSPAVRARSPSAKGSVSARAKADKRHPSPPRRSTGATTAPPSGPVARGVWSGGIAIALAAALHVWTGLKTAELGYERSRAVELSRRLENQREELADEYAGLLRTEYLEEESARRLGLVAPSAGQVVDLRRKQLAAAPRGYRR